MTKSRILDILTLDVGHLLEIGNWKLDIIKFHFIFRLFDNDRAAKV